MDRELPDSIARNVEHWTKNNLERLDGHAAYAWSRDDLTWGIFGIREEELGSPLGDVRDLRAPRFARRAEK